MSEPLRDDLLDAIVNLSFIGEFRDTDAGHLPRLSAVARLLAEALGLPPAEVELIGLAAPMHDVGKAGIADEILLKPGRLTNEERADMQGHTVLGAKLLANGTSAVVRLGARIARSHHERWDGTGYPDALAGAETPIAARIVGLADGLDAMVTRRVYKPAVTLDEAFGEVRAARGKQFDPGLVDAFLRVEDRLRAIYADAGDDEDDEGWLA